MVYLGGRASDLTFLSQLFGTGHGTVLLFLNRVIAALAILYSHDVSWPGRAERSRLSREARVADLIFIMVSSALMELLFLYKSDH